MKGMFRKFEEENIISFSNKKELIRFVSSYMAIQYRKFLDMEYAMAMDSEEEKCYLKIKISSCVSKFEKVLRVILHVKLMSNKNFEINHESTILKVAFKYAEETVQPRACFANNVKYSIKDLTFEKSFF